jgi:hypothetical protein
MLLLQLCKCLLLLQQPQQQQQRQPLQLLLLRQGAPGMEMPTNRPWQQLLVPCSRWASPSPQMLQQPQQLLQQEPAILLQPRA